MIVAVCAAAFGFYFYNKPRTGVNELKADYTLDAVELLKQYQDDESSANSKYLGKVIEVNGIVKNIAIDDRGTMNVAIDGGNELASINCQFEKKEAPPRLHEGDAIKVKGFCSGLLLDVVMVDCQLIKYERN